MRRLAGSLKLLSRGVDALLVVLFVIMAAAITWQVFARYVLGDPTRWSEELARFLVAWVTMLGAAAVMRDPDGHVAVTVVVERLRGTPRRIADLLRDAIVFLSAGTLAWYGYELALRALGQQSPGLGISVTWAYAAIPVGAVLIPVFLLGARVADPGRERRD